MISLFNGYTPEGFDSGHECSEEPKKMKNTQKAGLALTLLLGLALMLVMNTNQQSKAENRELTKAVFKVA